MTTVVNELTLAEILTKVKARLTPAEEDLATDAVIETSVLAAMEDATGYWLKERTVDAGVWLGSALTLPLGVVLVTKVEVGNYTIGFTELDPSCWVQSAGTLDLTRDFPQYTNLLLRATYLANGTRLTKATAASDASISMGCFQDMSGDFVDLGVQPGDWIYCSDGRIEIAGVVQDAMTIWLDGNPADAPSIGYWIEYGTPVGLSYIVNAVLADLYASVLAPSDVFEQKAAAAKAAVHAAKAQRVLARRADTKALYDKGISLSA
jgi:hypothetical protein